MESGFRSRVDGRLHAEEREHRRAAAAGAVGRLVSADGRIVRRNVGRAVGRAVGRTGPAAGPAALAAVAGLSGRAAGGGAVRRLSRCSA